MGFVAAFVVSLILLLGLSFRWWTHKPENRKILMQRQWLGLVLATACSIFAGMSINNSWEPRDAWTLIVMYGIIPFVLFSIVSVATKDHKPEA